MTRGKKTKKNMAKKKDKSENFQTFSFCNLKKQTTEKDLK